MREGLLTTQMCIFDIFNLDNIETSPEKEEKIFSFDSKDKDKFDNYTLEDYSKDIVSYGLKVVWDKINYYVLNFDNNNAFLNVDNLGELYEIGLALISKQQKKVNGQYYTPEDVAKVMSAWFDRLEAENICDVACGTGKLMLTYLNLIGEKKTLQKIREGKLYLYDIDNIALDICKTIFTKKYGDVVSNIHFIHCDFLNKKIVLPNNCKVISNPPYSAINNFLLSWERTPVAIDTKEAYSMFMEKILKQSKSAVIITPYSFIGANKFYSLRLLLNNYNGFIISFDNVPGNIFHGRKHGIFNSNTSNSVRAAITVVENKKSKKGFCLSPLLRFKNQEREKLLQCNLLESLLSNKSQIISKKNSAYAKCQKDLQNVFDEWLNKSSKKLKDILVSKHQKFKLYVPNTCRYFTTASSYKLKRAGMICLEFANEETFNFAYCLINSSFAYWWWRIYDGGITYPKGLLYRLPVFVNILSEDDKKFFKETYNEMKEIEKECIITKLNSGSIQENIKFPISYRNKLNKRLLSILGFDSLDVKIFNKIHKNNVFEEIDN